MTNTRVEEIAQNKIDKIELKDYKGIQDYINQLEQYRLDIRDANREPYSDRQMIPKIFRGLPQSYQPFRTQHNFYNNLPSSPHLSLEDITYRLLTFKSQLAKQDRNIKNFKTEGKSNNTKPDKKGSRPKQTKKCLTKGCRT